jgi:hypothetical protein
MGKSNKIKWRRSDEDLLRRTVKNFNAKISGVNKRHPELAKYQPERANFKELKQQLKNLPRSEFKKEIARLRRYSKKGAEQIREADTGGFVTNYSFREITIYRQTINREKAKRRKEKQFTGEKAMEGNRFISEREADLLPERSPKKLSERGWRDLEMRLYRQQKTDYRNAQQKLYRENILTAVSRVYGGGSALLFALSKLTAEQLIDFYYESPYLSFDYIYSEQEREIIEDTIIDEIMDKHPEYMQQEGIDFEDTDEFAWWRLLPEERDRMLEEKGLI